MHGTTLDGFTARAAGRSVPVMPRHPLGDGVTVIATPYAPLYGAGLRAKVPFSRLAAQAARWKTGQRRRLSEVPEKTAR